MLRRFSLVAALIASTLLDQVAFASPNQPTIVSFPNGALTLRGELFMPKEKGSFPAVLYNHGSAGAKIRINPFFLIVSYANRNSS